nr:MAG TPA: hypothetical protein [Caudoviricetes sp.]
MACGSHNLFNNYYAINEKFTLDSNCPHDYYRGFVFYIICFF